MIFLCLLPAPIPFFLISEDYAQNHLHVNSGRRDKETIRHNPWPFFVKQHDIVVLQKGWRYGKLCFMSSTADEFLLMSNASPLKWRHFEAEIILLYVRWYLR